MFKIDPASGSLTTIYSFPCHSEDGSTPNGPLVYTNNHLYGTTHVGGDLSSTYGYGTIFEVDLAKQTERALYRFKNNGDGVWPASGLVLAKNGDQRLFYGTTSGRWNGYRYTRGSVFSFVP